MSKKYRIIITGACGKMGRAIINGIFHEPDIQIVGAVDTRLLGKDIGLLVGRTPKHLHKRQIRAGNKETGAQIMIDLPILRR